ncbi:hypothetical protein RQN30_09365 [Arcanobacterium hippocoleae]
MQYTKTVLFSDQLALFKQHLALTTNSLMEDTTSFLGIIHQRNSAQEQFATPRILPIFPQEKKLIKQHKSLTILDGQWQMQFLQLGKSN